MSGKVHACTEVRAHVWVRTFCGVEVKLVRDSGFERLPAPRWWSRGGQSIEVTRDPRAVTCGRCLNSMH